MVAAPQMRKTRIAWGAKVRSARRPTTALLAKSTCTASSAQISRRRNTGGCVAGEPGGDKRNHAAIAERAASVGQSQLFAKLEETTMSFVARLKEHPKGFWVVFWGELAERSSYYGMRTLLALYL